MRSGTRIAGEHLVIDCYFGKTDSPKLGVTVSKRYGKAHERNRFKRLVREAFRLNRHLFSTNLEINVLPRNKGIHNSRAAIEKELISLINQLTDK